MDLAGYILLIIGAVCSLIGAVGLIRLPDVYNRLHASTVAVVGGAVVVIGGAGLLNGADTFLLKSAIIAFFIFFTTPTGSHAIARAAYIRGPGLSSETVRDDIADRDIRNLPECGIDDNLKEVEDLLEE